MEDLDLEVRKGEIYAFLGRNGAGKTTTIRMMLGLIRPLAGEVRVSVTPVGQVRIGDGGLDQRSDRPQPFRLGRPHRENLDLHRGLERYFMARTAEVE